MLVHSVHMQLSGMLRKKTAVLTYLILLTFVMFNFFSNVIQNYDLQYISQMYDPLKIITLSDWSVSGYFMMEFFPLLVVVPTACSYLTDRETRIKVYIESRTGKSYYWIGKFIAVFMTTFLIFTIPFLMEIILNCFCFSLSSMGDPSNFSYIQTIKNENQYFLSQLWLENRVLYVVVQTLIFGAVAAVLAVFNFAITLLPFFKYKIFTFFPIYILCYLILVMEKIAGTDYTMNYFQILRFFNLENKNYSVYGLFLIVIFCFSLVLAGIKMKKDDLLWNIMRNFYWLRFLPDFFV